jgi:50S ribosomal protein L16 3-hydroxylase
MGPMSRPTPTLAVPPGAAALTQPLPLLGGLSPARFMRHHWQKKPLLVRQAWPGVQSPLPRQGLFALAGQEGTESRLVERRGAGNAAADWRVRHGPFARRSLPPASRPGWTLLVQGLDLHVPAARALLDAFRFVPDARLDDLMVSWASDGGGVGPHLDAYDVFLLQVQGRRRWRIGPLRPGQDARFVPGAPLKLLRHLEPEQAWVLEPGDLLYLPPGWGHDGVAVGGDCMTCSVGFRAPSMGELAADLIGRLADEVAEALAEERGTSAEPGGRRYRDPRQPPTTTPAALPVALADFARQAVQRALDEDPRWLARTLGESLSDPKPGVCFEAGGEASAAGAVVLDRRTRMLYDADHVFINGQAYEAAGRDAQLMQRLADCRRLQAAERRRLGAGAAALLSQWLADGWVHAEGPASAGAA